MSIISRATNKLVTTYQKDRFDRIARKVRSTPPISNFDLKSNVTILAMVQKKDVDMFLLAAKSFARHVAAKRFFIITDPSIDEEDLKILRHHLVNFDHIPAVSLRQDGIPSGGCWERISGIATQPDGEYVIQLDADTLTIRKPVEVLQCIAEQRSFTLGTNSGRKIGTLNECARFAKEHEENGNKHIQILSEARLEGLPDQFKHYVRGCAGFAGFAPGSISKNQLNAICEYYYKNLGERWNEWGSEQFASNLIIANSENPVVLSPDDYAVPAKNTVNAKFFHYIGTVRFTNGHYRKHASIVMAGIKEND